MEGVKRKLSNVGNVKETYGMREQKWSRIYHRRVWQAGNDDLYDDIRHLSGLALVLWARGTLRACLLPFLGTDLQGADCTRGYIHSAHTSILDRYLMLRGVRLLTASGMWVLGQAYTFISTLRGAIRWVQCVLYRGLIHRSCAPSSSFFN